MNLQTNNEFHGVPQLAPLPQWVPEPPRETPLPESYEALVSPHLLTLRRWVSSKVQNPFDVDDVVQQTLFLSFRHLGQFRFEASFGTWLCRIALNVIRGRMRSPDFSRTVYVEPEKLEHFNLHDLRHSPQATLERKEAKAKVHLAIAKLPQIYQEVIRLRDLRGLSIRETAFSLGLTKPAVKSRHHRARILLLRFLGETQRPQTVN
jgi:RNA polymerase sigma-70 factor, ECF subfamily